MAGILLALASLVAVVVIAVRDVQEKAPRLDKRSYEAGYGALGGAWLPPSEEDRATTVARCEETWVGYVRADEHAHELRRADWVSGCVDFVEGKDSRFAPK
ncbi:hypothetical protein [Streptomyces sp. NPDC057002]|uniref:hypothetical protein n=1 Tax=Streptomyces sp. NPDC057002 TaxID=3345992 RepID=UPI003624E9E1